MLPKEIFEKKKTKELKSVKQFTNLGVDKEESVIFRSVCERLYFFKYTHTSENIHIIHK
jgi:hypothetical protein